MNCFLIAALAVTVICAGPAQGTPAEIALSEYATHTGEFDTMPVRIAAAEAPAIPTPLPAPIPVMPQNYDQPAPVITVSQPNTVAFGDVAGAVLSWLAVVLGPVLAGFAVDWFVKLRKKLGVDTTDAQRAKLQEVVENGINLAAHQGQHDLSGKLSFQVKNQILGDAVKYAQTHGADTLKALGAPDPNDPKVVEALQARVASILSTKDQQATAMTAGASPVVSPAAA